MDWIWFHSKQFAHKKSIWSNYPKIKHLFSAPSVSKRIAADKTVNQTRFSLSCRKSQPINNSVPVPIQSEIHAQHDASVSKGLFNKTDLQLAYMANDANKIREQNDLTYIFIPLLLFHAVLFRFISFNSFNCVVLTRICDGELARWNQ